MKSIKEREISFCNRHYVDDNSYSFLFVVVIVCEMRESFKIKNYDENSDVRFSFIGSILSRSTISPLSRFVTVCCFCFEIRCDHLICFILAVTFFRSTSQLLVNYLFPQRNFCMAASFLSLKVWMTATEICWSFVKFMNVQVFVIMKTSGQLDQSKIVK